MSSTKILIDTIALAAYDVYVKRALELKADKTTVSALTSTVDSKADKTAVEALQSSLSSKADKTTVDTLSSNITEVSNAVNSKADKTAVNGLSKDLGDLTSTVNGLEGRVSNLEDNTPSSYDPIFKLLDRKTAGTSGELYIDLSTYMAEYKELMIIIRSVVNAETTIGISNSTSGTSFNTSTTVTGTKYTKLVMNKTDEGNYAWTIGPSFGWSTSADYKYLKYSGSATSVSINAVIHGR